MALTIGKVNLDNRDHVIGNRREVVLDVTLDTAYPAGGYPLTAASLGVDIATDYIRADATTTGHVFAYDYANSKLRVFSGGSEVSTSTDLHTVVVRLIAQGKGNPVY